MDAPSFEMLEQRLKKRGTESAETIEKRLKTAKEEIAGVKNLEYYEHIVNGDLLKTQKELIEFVNKHYELNLAV